MWHAHSVSNVRVHDEDEQKNTAWIVTWDDGSESVWSAVEVRQWMAWKAHLEICAEGVVQTFVKQRPFTTHDVNGWWSRDVWPDAVWGIRWEWKDTAAWHDQWNEFVATKMGGDKIRALQRFPEARSVTLMNMYHMMVTRCIASARVIVHRVMDKPAPECVRTQRKRDKDETEGEVTAEELAEEEAEATSSLKPKDVDAWMWVMHICFDSTTCAACGDDADARITLPQWSELRFCSSACKKTWRAKNKSLLKEWRDLVKAIGIPQWHDEGVHTFVLQYTPDGDMHWWERSDLPAMYEKAAAMMEDE